MDIFSGTFGLILLVILVFWVVASFLLPFFVLSIRDNMKEAVTLLKQINRKLDK